MMYEEQHLENIAHATDRDIRAQENRALSRRNKENAIMTAYQAGVRVVRIAEAAKSPERTIYKIIARNLGDTNE